MSSRREAAPHTRVAAAADRGRRGRPGRLGRRRALGGTRGAAPPCGRPPSLRVSRRCQAALAIRLIVLDGALASAPCRCQGGTRSRHRRRHPAGPAGRRAGRRAARPGHRGRAGGPGTTPGTRCWQRATVITVSRCDCGKPYRPWRRTKLAPAKVLTRRRPPASFSYRTTCSAPPGPMGWTSRPPVLSWAASGRGTRGNAAQTTAASNGACSGAPSVPSPARTITWPMPSAARLRRARSARSGQISMLTTRAASRASSAVW